MLGGRAVRAQLAVGDRRDAHRGQDREHPVDAQQVLAPAAYAFIIMRCRLVPAWITGSAPPATALGRIEDEQYRSSTRPAGCSSPRN